MRIAVILSCYNRKKLTERCLKQITESIVTLEDSYVKIYVFDDASTDGTLEMIRDNFKNVIILEGLGNYYWTRSMYTAMERAVKEQYDYYMMINDDVDFYPHVFKIMLEAYKEAGKNCGIVGATRYAGICTYGGRTREEKLMVPNGKLQKCMWANWNCFLIPHSVVEKVGLLDNKYQHAFGDYDYSYRMHEQGIPIYVAGEYIGECKENDTKGTYQDSSLSRKKRLKLLFSPKGMPFRSYMRYHIKIHGNLGVLRYIYGYMSMIGYILVKRKI